MIKSYKITDTLFVNEQVIDMPKKEFKVEAKHQYIILDRSGSMWSELDKIADVIINYVDTLTEGSTVSLGYFSGNGQYGLSVPYVLKKEKDGVVNTINEYRHALGMTNFIEILDKVNNDVKEKSSLFFFTDGCHNCGSFSKVTELLEQLKDKLEISVFVGCGYIDRNNMNEMARVSNGSFIQLQSFSQFKDALYDFKDSIEESVPGCEVTLHEDAFEVCSLIGKNVITYNKKDNKVFYKASNKKKQVIYYLSTLPLGDLSKLDNRNELAFRTLAYTLVQHNDVPKALLILNHLGEKYYIQKLYNTFTNDEYAVIETEMARAIHDSRVRYKEGKVENYLPDDNAFCVLDALDIIAKDEKVKVHLNDEDFVYEKISKPTEQTDGSKLVYPKDIQATAKDLKYNDTRLNVNLNEFYQASVPLDVSKFSTKPTENELVSYGLKNKDKYPVNCIRNYNIILDGKLQTKKLVVSGLSKDSINKLATLLTAKNKSKYILDLSSLTLINKSYLQGTSAEKLARDCWQAYELSNEVSVLKYLKDINEVKSSDEDKPLELIDFLSEKFYIKNGMYQPPKTTVESTDCYKAYEFKISFKGNSKPTASSVIRKLHEGKAITPREQIVETYYDKYKKLSYNEIVVLLGIKRREYIELQTQIQKAKFGIILINRGCMDEFNNREDMQLDINVNGKIITAKFEITEKEIAI